MASSQIHNCVCADSISATATTFVPPALDCSLSRVLRQVGWRYLNRRVGDSSSTLGCPLYSCNFLFTRKFIKTGSDKVIVYQQTNRKCSRSDLEIRNNFSLLKGFCAHLPELSGELTVYTIFTTIIKKNLTVYTSFWQ